MFGSVAEANLQALLHRLRGLCDNATEGGLEFCDREITYKIEATGVGSSKVRVRQSLDAPDAPWYLIYSGQVEPGDSHKLTAVRTCVHTACSHTLLEILQELRFEPIAEVILKGYLFKKGAMKIAVFKLYPGAGDPDSATPLSPLYLVELSAVTPSGQDTIESEMKAFADHLKPIVNMDKPDGNL